MRKCPNCGMLVPFPETCNSDECLKKDINKAFKQMVNFK